MADNETQIVEALQASARLHWTAREFYLAASVHLKRWGYPGLGKHFADELMDEDEHLAHLIEQLEFYDAEVDFSHDPPTFTRGNPMVIISEALSLESDAFTAEQNGIKVCRHAGDEVSALLIAENLRGTRDSIVLYTGWLASAEVVGTDNFLANFMK